MPNSAGGDAPARQYKSGEERRREIVEATLAILAEEGMHAWTTSALAGRVGVSEATLFKHFDSKDEILSAALRRQAEELRARIEAYEPEGPSWQRVMGLAREVMDYLEANEGGPLVILLGHAARIRPEMRDEVEKTGERFRERLTDFLGEGEGTSGTRSEVVAGLVIAVIQSACLRWSVRGHEGSLAEKAEPMLAFLEECAAATGGSS